MTALDCAGVKRATVPSDGKHGGSPRRAGERATTATARAREMISGVKVGPV